MHRFANPLSYFSDLVVVLVICGWFQVALAQNKPGQDGSPKSDPMEEPSRVVPQPVDRSSEQKSTPQTNSSAYVIGPGDEVEVTVYGTPDLSKRTRVSDDGNISIPLIGSVRVGGLSSSEAEGAIEAQLRQNNILNDPQVSVYVKEYMSSGISVVGEVAKPGVYSVFGPHRLSDVVRAAGGLSEKASSSVTISHRGDEENPVTVELSKDPAKMVRSDVELHPGDTVFAAKAPMVYVLGEVNKPGGYILNSADAATVLRVIAAAAGPTRSASVGRTRMLRRTPTGWQELPVQLKAILQGKTADIPVSDADIIFVPSSRMKNIVALATVIATSAATTAIYHVY